MDYKTPDQKNAQKIMLLEQKWDQVEQESYFDIFDNGIVRLDIYYVDKAKDKTNIAIGYYVFKDTTRQTINVRVDKLDNAHFVGRGKQLTEDEVIKLITDEVE
jgi:hypothetical protein